MSAAGSEDQLADIHSLPRPAHAGNRQFVTDKPGVRKGFLVAMATILDDQAKCAQRGSLHFAIVSFSDPHVTLSCLECGYVWNLNQPVEDESKEGPSGDGGS